MKFLTKLKIIICILALISIVFKANSEKNLNYFYSTTKETKSKLAKKFLSESYADSIIKTLSLDEKIAQLIFLDVYPNKKEAYYKTIDKWVEEKKIGGILLFRGEPAEISRLSSRFYSKAEIPLWISMDAEWGISMRVDSIRNLPKAMTLGAISNNDLVREYGYLVGIQCRRLNVNINMAPVSDVNNNPKNPVINYRSFGECRYNVSNKSISYFLGLNDAGVLAVGKHFPGHGNTDTDSHYELPIIKDSKQVIDSIHLFPFKELIKYEVPGIMSAHIFIPAIDNTRNLAASLSSKVLNDLLKTEMGFSGLVFTDALNMKGVSKYFVPGQLEVMALKAGNDILLMPPNPQLSIDSIKAAVKDGRIKESEIDEKVRKVLEFKYLYLNEFTLNNEPNNIPAELNSTETANFISRVFAASNTLLKNDNNFLPLNKNSKEKIAVVSVGRRNETSFQKTLKEHVNSSFFSFSNNPTETEIVRLENQLKNFDKVIICVYGITNNPRRNYGVTTEMNNLITRITRNSNSGLILFGNAYALNFIRSLDNFNSVVVTYELMPEAEVAAANSFAGLNSFNGILPVSLDKFELGTGIVTTPETGKNIIKNRFNNEKIKIIDSIIQDAINQRAFPGCQVAIMKDGEFVFVKSYGYHTYENKTKVKDDDIYDLASLTKILATTTAIMKLFQENKIMLNDRLSEHLPYLNNTPVGNITIKEVLAHQGGFRSWIPFFRLITSNEVMKAHFFASEANENFNVKIADNLYMNSTFKDSIFTKIRDEKLLSKKYRYSDLGFLLLAEIVEKITKEEFDNFLQNNFYLPMGLNSITFNPLSKFSRNRIVPTEDDKNFRNQLVHGYVHDQAAAMLGGVAGNAGLFGSATDVAIMMQMFLNKGNFEGKQLLDTMVVSKFTSRPFANNRRGLGFDKPTTSVTNRTVAAEASQMSFGHTGFTGTIAWADPKNNLVFVFLSNRINPNPENRLLMTLNIREQIHSIAYRAFAN